MGRTKELANFVSGIEEAAYRRGYNDGLRDASAALKKLRHEASNEQAQEPLPASASNGRGHLAGGPDQVERQPRLRKNSDQMRVLEAIRAVPGMRGMEIVRAVGDIQERTVRTALSRLKGAGYIEQREDRWFQTDTGQTR